MLASCRTSRATRSRTCATSRAGSTRRCSPTRARRRRWRRRRGRPRCRSTVDADGVGRYPQEIEAAVYFCALEALNNVAKYAEA